MGSGHKGDNAGKKRRVSARKYKKGLRLRWTFGEKRSELYIPSTVPLFLAKAQILSGRIEEDITKGDYDPTLNKYREILNQDFEPETERSITNPVDEIKPLDLSPTFIEYMRFKGKEDDTNYYLLTLKMLQRWGTISLQDIAGKLTAEKIAAKTFNDRRNCLFKFFQWMIRRKKIRENPLIDVSNKRRARRSDKRKPLSDREATAVLQALKGDSFRKKSSRYSHSQYYPFVSFLLHTGVRNAEAIGLRVKDVNFDCQEICISHSFARTSNGTHASARKWKGTKTDNVRYLPLTEMLGALLHPLCINKKPGDFVFVNSNGNPIDDRMFLRRVFRPVLSQLGIDNRDLYCCRHTFATRAVQQGMKPHEVAYLMGDSVQTVLENYFHNNR